MISTTGLRTWLRGENTAAVDKCGATWRAYGDNGELAEPITSTLVEDNYNVAFQCFHCGQGRYLACDGVTNLNAEKWTFHCLCMYEPSSTEDDAGTFFSIGNIYRSGERIGIHFSKLGVAVGDGTEDHFQWEQAYDSEVRFPSKSNRWVHLAVVKDGDTLTLYEDGKVVTWPCVEFGVRYPGYITTESAGEVLESLPLHYPLEDYGKIGLGDSYRGLGERLSLNFAEVMYHDGVALWTEDFTPPTQEDYVATALELERTKKMGDITKVTKADIIAGLEKIEEVYPRFGLIPGTIIAPTWSRDAEVSLEMEAKTRNINGCFQTIAVTDLGATLSGWSIAPVKIPVSERVAICYPKVTVGSKVYNLSTHVAALMARVDATHDDLPYKSPSNETLQIDGAKTAEGAEVWLTKQQANFLNGHGIVTALRFAGAWRCWGNRTSAYDISGGTTDPKDSFIPVRRMMNWIENTLTVSFWSKIDYPINKRTVESVLDSAKIWLNGLVARGALVGGKIEILEEENPITDLSDGIIRFHVSICPPSPAREIEFIMEYQPKFYESLFE